MQSGCMPDTSARNSCTCLFLGVPIWPNYIMPPIPVIICYRGNRRGIICIAALPLLSSCLLMIISTLIRFPLLIISSSIRKVGRKRSGGVGFPGRLNWLFSQFEADIIKICRQECMSWQCRNEMLQYFSIYLIRSE